MLLIGEYPIGQAGKHWPLWRFPLFGIQEMHFVDDEHVWQFEILH